MLHTHTGGVSTTDRPAADSTRPTRRGRTTSAASSAKLKKPSSTGIFTMKVRSASAALGSQAKLADWAGVNRAQPGRWADGDTEPSANTARAVTDLEFIIARAGMVWDETVIPDWLNGNNAFLGGATPLEMIRQGRTSEVLDAITGDESGVYA